MGTLSCDVPLYLHCMMWLGRHHAKLLTDTIPIHLRFQYHHRFNSIQATYFPLRCFRRRRLRNRRNIENRVLTCPLDVPVTIHYTTLVQWFQKNVALCNAVLHSAVRSFVIPFYGELIVWMLGNKNTRRRAPKSMNISLLILWILKNFW